MTFLVNSKQDKDFLDQIKQHTKKWHKSKSQSLNIVDLVQSARTVFTSKRTSPPCWPPGASMTPILDGIGKPQGYDSEFPTRKT